MPARSAAERSEIASLAAHERWGRVTDRSSATAMGRAALRARFEAEVPDSVTDPDQRRSMTDHLIVAHMIKERRSRRQRVSEAQLDEAAAELERAGFGFPGVSADGAA